MLAEDMMHLRDDADAIHDLVNEWREIEELQFAAKLA